MGNSKYGYVAICSGVIWYSKCFKKMKINIYVIKLKVILLWAHIYEMFIVIFLLFLIIPIKDKYGNQSTTLTYFHEFLKILNQRFTKFKGDNANDFVSFIRCQLTSK